MNKTPIQINILEFAVEGKLYYSSADKIVSNCNCITFINQGNSTITITPLEVVLYPSQQFVVGGNIGEYDRTQYGWRTTNNPGEQPALNVVRKTYKGIQ